MKSLRQCPARLFYRFRPRLQKCVNPFLAYGCLLAVFALTPLPAPSQSLRELNISGISTQAGAAGTVVSIAADGPLSRAQLWQDSEGYHVVIPHATTAGAIKTDKGVKLRTIGKSLEILIQTSPGAEVIARSTENRINLSIEGKLEPRFIPREVWEDTSAVAAKLEEQQLLWQNQSRSQSAAAPGSPSETTGFNSSNEGTAQVSSPVTTSTTEHSASNSAPTTNVPSSQIVPQQDGTKVKELPETQIVIQTEEDGLLASVFSGTGVIIILLLGIIGLIVVRRIRSGHNVVPGTSRVAHVTPPEDDLVVATDSQGPRSLGAHDQGMPNNGSGGDAGGGGTSKEGKSNVQQPATSPSLYGAYRIDQEVGKLVLGQPHRTDVLSSRAPDDRRAIETSLIKTLSASNADEDMCKKAREALEEYGFVARQCAAMLMAPDAFERTLAARTLGEMQSAIALPFLLEALYDQEAIVRNQAVLSIGELRIPSAIGALLDMARKHPDVPSSLLSRALSACSLDGLDFFDTSFSGEPVSGIAGPTVIHEITQLEPTASVEELPESSDDEQLMAALSLLNSEEIEERSKAVKDLGQFPLQIAVEQLAETARKDPHPGIRSLAIASLATINHESVFPSVLIGMADESREVRAAAARALSRLGFVRADAYVRVMETADQETLTDVANACIQAGIVYQEIDRLVSTDRRLAYEAFCILSLISKVQMTEPILEAIKTHENPGVRLACLRLLASSANPVIIDQLRELVSHDGLTEEITTALLETLYQLDLSNAANSEEASPHKGLQDTQPAVEVVTKIDVERKPGL
ncbi:MAG TPA: HEAT repeat domain-containing protein [Pyrinomonadaceae bacterium]|nr:HEAT repeat domain-containing protein [Pyrinomonadaceae bacterium]